MKKKIFISISLILIVIFILAGCGGGENIVGIEMTKPESTNGELKFEDENIKFNFFPYADSSGLKGIAFEIQNKTDEVMKVKWNEASLVNPQGIASRVMHAGVKYADRDKEITTTTIPPGARIKDNVSPTDNAYYSSSSGWFSSKGWKITPIIKAENIKGQKISLLMPIEIEEQTKNYQFDFKVYSLK